MEANPSIHDLINRLAATPALIAHATQELSETAINTGLVQGEWSIAEIFAHIRAVDDLWIPRIYGMMVRDRPVLIAFDERLWAELVGYAHADFRESLTLYTLRRAELIHMLSRLVPDDWERVGLHEEYGPISLLNLITGWVKHEEEHYAQLAAFKTTQR